MRRRRLCIFAALVVGLGISTAAADQNSAEAVLTQNGLHRLEHSFILAGESDIGKKLHDAEAAQRKVFDAEKKAAAAEKRVSDKKQLLATYAQQRRDSRAQLENTRNAAMHNRIVNMLNELGDRSQILIESQDEEKAAKAARATAMDLSEHSVELLLKVREQYHGLKQKYDKLAADKAVAKAIEQYNQSTGKNCRLGPSASFVSYGHKLAKLSNNLLSETIALRHGDGDLWHVAVTFGGKHVQDMAIDTVQASSPLPWNAAEAAGLTPTSQDETLHVHLADGSVVSAKRVFAPSVRVGPFVVKHVECAVMPQGLQRRRAVARPELSQAFLLQDRHPQGYAHPFQIEKGGESKSRSSDHPGSKKKTSTPTPK